MGAMVRAVLHGTQNVQGQLVLWEMQTSTDSACKSHMQASRNHVDACASCDHVTCKECQFVELEQMFDVVQALISCPSLDKHRALTWLEHHQRPQRFQMPYKHDKSKQTGRFHHHSNNPRSTLLGHGLYLLL